MAWHPGERYVTTWRIGINSLLMSLSVSMLLLFLYVQSQHTHRTDSYYSNHALFSKPAITAHDAFLPLSSVLVEAILCFCLATCFSSRAVAAEQPYLSDSTRILNCRAPPPFNVSGESGAWMVIM